MPRSTDNSDRDFFADLLEPFIEKGNRSLPVSDVQALELRLERADWRKLSYQLSQSQFSTDGQFLLLPQTSKNGQVPALALDCEYGPIPRACLKVCINVVDGASVRTFGLRFESAALVEGAIGAHSFAHAQLTSALDLGYASEEGDSDCHDTHFASYPALFTGARSPGDLLLTTLLSVYGLAQMLAFIDREKHFFLRQELLGRLKSLLPEWVVDQLPNDV